MTPEVDEYGAAEPAIPHATEREGPPVRDDLTDTTLDPPPLGPSLPHRESGGLTARGWIRTYVLLGGLVLVLAAFHVVVGHTYTRFLHTVLFLAFSVGAAGSIWYTAHWHHQHPFPAGRYPRIAAWTVVGGLLVAAAGLVGLFVGSEVVTVEEFLESAHLMGSVGLAVGFLMGTMEARVMESATGATRAGTLEAERERLALLNDLLRHYVLNGITVIGGYAQTLEGKLEGREREQVQVIGDRAAVMGDVVDHISVLTKTRWEQEAVREADIGAAIEAVVAETCREGISLDVPETPPAMLANVGYRTGVELLVGAIEQIIADGGTVSVEVAPEEGRLSIVAAPAELPPGLEAEVLEPVAAEVGLELYLAARILEPAIELDVVSRDASTVAVDLRGEFVTR